MPLYALLVVSSSSILLLAHYFVGVVLDEQDKYEYAIASQIKLDVKLPEGGGDRCFVCKNLYTLVRKVGNVLYILSGNDECDEFALSTSMDLIVSTFETICEEKTVSENSILAFQGKLIAALSEAYLPESGICILSDPKKVALRAKLKPAEAYS
jgi:hypothetical protein